MSHDVQKKDPKLMSKVIGLIESGQTPEQIAKTLLEDVEQSRLDKEEGHDVNSDDEEEEDFPSEIRLIAQALCFRFANVVDDKIDILNILNKSYMAETIDHNNSKKKNEESFRRGAPICEDDINELFGDVSYKWIVVEAPNGHGIEKDGAMLGVCCYSTDGVSRKNGEIEGKLGSIRFMGILPRYHGLCIGLRLLRRAESEMLNSGCCRVMACIPSPRLSMQNWLTRRGYSQAGSSPYPAASLGHELIAIQNESQPEVTLSIYLKALQPLSAEADEKETVKTILSINKANSSSSSSSSLSSLSSLSSTSSLPTVAAVETSSTSTSTSASTPSDINSPPSPPPQRKGKMHLPPHWRMESQQHQHEEIPDVD